MSLKIAIIGAGWYGCHIGHILDTLDFEVKIFEKNNDIFLEASGNNQFRLHLGFHYARDYRTRLQSRDGYHRFLERYNDLTEEIKDNLYIVPENDSLIDDMTYKMIMLTSGIEFEELNSSTISNEFSYLKHSKLVFNTDERIILTNKAKEYYKRVLNAKIIYNTKIESIEENSNGVIVNGERFDFVIDATWGHYSNKKENFFFEPTLLLYYKTDQDFPALTYVDGPLCSLYPTEEKGTYTLSSVTHTPLGKYNEANKARDFIENIDSNLIKEKINAMETEISKYVPDFKKHFTYKSPQLSIKTKSIVANDDRSCYVETYGRMITIISGKIDTIFYASQEVINILSEFKEKKND